MGTPYVNINHVYIEKIFVTQYNNTTKAMTVPGMSVAGRGFTSYLSNASMNNNLKKKYDIKDNNEYKEFIQKNGSSMSATLKSRNTELVKNEQWWLVQK